MDMYRRKLLLAKLDSYLDSLTDDQLFSEIELIGSRVQESESFEEKIRRRLELGTSNNIHLVWLDFETTGFNTSLHIDPKTGQELLGCQYNDILEVAVVITDLTLEPKGELCLAIRAEDIDFSKMDDWCTNTHTKSGLVDRCKQSTISLKEAEQQVLSLIKSFGIERKQAYLAGNSIYFDMMFISAHMRELLDYLHYRLVDVTSYKTPMVAIHPEFEDKLNVMKTDRHEALIDIHESINEFRMYIEKI